MTRRSKWALGILAVLVVVVATASMFARPVLSNWVRTELARHVENHFDGTLNVDSFDVVLFPVVRIEGTGLKLRRNAAPDGPPLISAERFSATTSLRKIWNGGVKQIAVTGLTIYIAPGSRPSLNRKSPTAQGQAPGTPERAVADSRSGLHVDEILATNSRLEIAPNDPAGLPLVFDITHARLTDFSPDKAAEYEAKLVNPKPRGEVISSGSFGPWRADDPRQTEIAGLYSLAKADMSVFPGIGGTLDSAGHFTGALQALSVEGTATMPDFTVDTGGHPMRLDTSFSTRVDATNGNTYLDRVAATLGKSKISATGEVAGTKTSGGKTIRLKVTSDSALLEDFIYLVVSEDQAPMRGQLSFTSTMELPPGDEPVIEAIKLAGNFTITRGRFASDLVQDKVDELSRRGQGKPKDTEIDNVMSTFSGTYAMGNGVLQLPRFQFTVNGAGVTLAGHYAMRGEQLDFTGQLRLRAKISQTTTGFKSFLLKAVDPFFRKQGAGTVLPIRISGSVQKPEFKLNLFNRKG
jgi:hypothetical protein